MVRLDREYRLSNSALYFQGADVDVLLQVIETASKIQHFPVHLTPWVGRVLKNYYAAAKPSIVPVSNEVLL